MNRNRRTIFLAMLAASLAGCLSPTPVLDSRFGESMTALKAQQTLNPDASRNDDPVAGIDGKAAKGALDNYRDRFRTPPSEAPNVINFGVGIPQQ